MDSEPEVVEFGGPAAPERHPWLLPVAGALAVGLAAGFLIGHRQRTPEQPAPTATMVNPIRATGRTCAITLPGPGGHPDLELGVQVRNSSAQPVTLRTPGVDLPLGGLPIARPPTLSACGELPGITDTILPGGDSTWLSVRVHVPKGDCPAAQPVLFVVNFHSERGDEQANVGGFNDLGTVPYPTCT